MKNLVIVAVAAISSVVFASSCNSSKAGNCDLKNNVDSVSYAIGFFNAKNIQSMLMQRCFTDTIDLKVAGKAFKGELKQEFLDAMILQFGEFNEDAFRCGFDTYMETGKGQIAEEVANAVCQARYQLLREQKQNEMEEKAQAAKVEGANFLAKNAQAEGIVVTESGLQYKVVTMGEGEKPTTDSRVKVLYTGKLLDGTVFDSTEKHGGEPAVFGLRGVIPAWTEALQLMPVGSKFIIYAPSELAYGERGAGENIPGNSVLEFEIELLEIVK